MSWARILTRTNAGEWYWFRVSVFAIHSAGVRLSGWWAVGGGGLALGTLLLTAYTGELGPLVACGADGARVCVAWPRLASAALWLGFVGILVGLTVAQSRDWRHLSVARRELLLLLVVLVPAVLERTLRPDLADVGYDEASAASLVASWRLDGLFPLTGIVSSVNIPNPPGWPYLLATVLLSADSPYAVVALGITASMLAVALTWWVGRRWIGAWGGLAAAVVYGGGFWAIFLGRSGWQPVFLQVPLILCLDALLILAIRRRPEAFSIACGWLAVMVQFHYIALVFVAPLAIATWPARRVVRPVHVVVGALIATALLTPFLIYELHPAVRFQDFAQLSAAAAGQGSHWDLEAWNLLWTLAGNGGAAGLGGADTEGLREALGRWSSLGMIGVPLVGCGILTAVAAWPRGWRGVLLATWTLTPAIGLAHHALGILFHYLYIGLPGMALAVGALAEWSAFRGPVAVRALIGGALTVYVSVSAATLWVVLDHVQRTGVYPDIARPLGINTAAALAARAALPHGGQVLIGGRQWDVEVLRFSIGHDLRPRVFDDCGDVPLVNPAIYVLNSEHAPAASALSAAGAPLLARVPRLDDAFLVYGEPPGTIPSPPAGPCR